MRYIEAPEITEFENGLFLAGGISGCLGWQTEITAMLSQTPYTILNPRRADFPMNDPTAAEAQIRWEHDHLRRAATLLFWFPCETLCPITLYELGAWSMTPKPLFIGLHPDYARRQDVEIQTRLIRPDVQIVYSLTALAEQLIAYAAATS